MTFISRRDLLKRAAIVGAGARAFATEGARAFSASVREPDEPATADEQASGHSAAIRGPLESLTAAEADILDAVVARLIPSDANGPGATEAHAVRYIDRALAGALAASRPAYTAGLAALDRYARSSRGKAFIELAPTDQDGVLAEVESGTAAAFAGSAAFFTMVLNHTHQGTFGDPYYGGNANYVGWDLLGYPGVRTMVSAADQQRLEKHELKTNHKSAYEYDVFTKADKDPSRRSSNGKGA